MDGAVGFEPTKEPSKGSGLPLAYTPMDGLFDTRKRLEKRTVYAYSTYHKTEGYTIP